MVVTDFKSTTAPASSITFSGVNIGAGTPIGSGGGALPGGIGLDGFPGAVIVRMWKP